MRKHTDTFQELIMAHPFFKSPFQTLKNAEKDNHRSEVLAAEVGPISVKWHNLNNFLHNLTYKDVKEGKILDRPHISRWRAACGPQPAWWIFHDIIYQSAL